MKSSSFKCYIRLIARKKCQITAFIQSLACCDIKELMRISRTYETACRNTRNHLNEGYKMSWFNLFPVGFSFSLEQIEKGAKLFSSSMRVGLRCLNVFIIITFFFFSHSPRRCAVCGWVSVALLAFILCCNYMHYAILQLTLVNAMELSMWELVRQLISFGHHSRSMSAVIMRRHRRGLVSTRPHTLML